MIHIVIPIYNRIESTLQCLSSIYSQKNLEINVIVVDDGSQDNSSQAIKESYPKVTVLNGTGSLFWTGAVRLGINYVLRICDKQDWVLLMNNDVQLTQGSIKNLVSFSESKKRRVITGALSVDLKDKDTIVKSGTRIKSYPLNITHHIYQGYSLSSLEPCQAVEVDLLTARCLLHPIEVFWTIGNYDAELLPHYGGDDEFTARAKRSGYGLYILPSTVVYLDNGDDNGKHSNRFLSGLFGIRSSVNLINKWKFTRSSVPMYARPTYYFIAIIKSIYVIWRR